MMGSVAAWVRRRPVASFFAFFLIFPFLVPYKALATQVLIYGLFALGFNLLYGYAGLLSFGHAAYFGLGAYGTGVVLARLHWESVWASLAVGLALAAAGGALIGYFCLRRRGIYFAMLSLAFAQLLYFVGFQLTGLTGGDDGLRGIPVLGYERWWTVLSAGWLHGSLLHIIFNMMWVRDLGPAVVDIIGPGRTVVIYTLSGVSGFFFSSFAGEYIGALPLLGEFGRARQALLDNGIIRSSRVVGDIGEAYAAQKLHLTLADDQTTTGCDAVDAEGRTFEIKTRRVYSSARRTSETRRINGLVGKSAETLVVVQLDHAFRCAGMWRMPLRNVINPKSANLTNILRTPGMLRVR